MAIDINYYKKINQKFYLKTGIINCYKELEELGLYPLAATGIFWPGQTPDLLKFCRKNPEFHIVTYISASLMVNRYEPEDHRYMLANKDNDPKLELNLPPEVVQHLMRESLLFCKRMKPEASF
mgnify:CR=1 FL=1